MGFVLQSCVTGLFRLMAVTKNNCGLSGSRLCIHVPIYLDLQYNSKLFGLMGHWQLLSLEVGPRSDKYVTCINKIV